MFLSRVAQAKCESALTLLERCRTDVKLSVKRKPKRYWQMTPNLGLVMLRLTQSQREQGAVANDTEASC